MSADTRQYTRLTYLAFGEMPDDLRAIVHEQCAQFHAALQAGRTGSEAAQDAAADAAEALRDLLVALGATEVQSSSMD